MDNSQLISVIIPTYNGAHKISNLLHALQEQSYKNFEVVVVIDGSSDSTEMTLKSLSVNFPITIIIQSNKGRSVTRNKGAKSAQGNLLLFFDDDIRPDKNCLLMHLKHHEEKPGTILVGSTLDDPKKAKSDIQKYKLHIGEQWLREIEHTEGPLTKNNIFVAAANLSIPKSTFLHLGGFDERLTDAEDYDLGVRALKENIKIFYDRNTISWHDDPITCKSYIKRQREYSRARLKLIKINPYAEQPTIVAGKDDNRMKKFVYNIFCRKLFVWLIDNFNIFIVLPSFLRYRLYSLIIWGLGHKFPDRSI